MRKGDLKGDLFNQLTKRLDVQKDPQFNIFHLESKTNTKNVLSFPGEFGLYALESKEQHFWGPSESAFDRLRNFYKDQWAMILLDGSATVGHFYKPQDADNSFPIWRPHFRITNENLGSHALFSNETQLFNLLKQTGAPC